MSVDSKKDYGEVIAKTNEALFDLMGNKKKWDNDDVVWQLYQLLYEAYWQEIHKILVPMEDEKRIRKYVKEVICKHLDPLYSKILRHSRKDGSQEYLAKYLQLYDDFYALAAFRSLKHYALYLEFDKPDRDKVWQNAMPCFEGFFYYANKMVLDGSVKRIVKQFPVGYGKSYSDAIFITWIFGYDINADVLKMVGNPTLVSDVMTTVTNTMLSKRYAKVFPYYSQFDCQRENLFSICKVQQGVLLINGSGRPKSMLCCSKDAAVDGGRYKYRFYDDITRSKDKENVNEHDKDWARYNDSWKKREYDENNSFEVAGGTAYSIYDFLSRYKEHYGCKKAKPSKHFKWVVTNKDTKLVSISVPKLDYDTDKCTYPAKFSTEEAVQERARDERTFMAMEQQTPLPPEGTPYYWDNLRLYEELPKREKDGGTRSDTCYAALDLPRKGKNYLALGIFSQQNDDFYFVDCIYQKKPLDADIGGKELLDYVCEKLVYHRVTNLVVETNTNSTIDSEIRKRLGALGWNCNIFPLYSTENKEVRIFNMQSQILERIIFPTRRMFAESSDMGQLMRHFVCYAYDGKNDDGVDMIAMFAKKYIAMEIKMGSISVLNRRI